MSGVEVEFRTGTDVAFKGVDVETLENGVETATLVFDAVVLSNGLDVEFANGVETGTLVLTTVVFINGREVELENGVETGMLLFAAVVFNIRLDVTFENVEEAKLELAALVVALMLGVLLALTALLARQCSSLVVVVRTVWLGPALLNKYTPALLSRGSSVVIVCITVLHDIL